MPPLRQSAKRGGAPHTKNEGGYRRVELADRRIGASVGRLSASESPGSCAVSIESAVPDFAALNPGYFSTFPLAVPA
jgi:hypothetical protein